MAALLGVVALLVAPALAAAQGVDQYAPSPPPQAGGGGGGGGGAGALGGGGTDGFVPDSTPSSGGAGGLDLETGTSGDAVGGGVDVSATPATGGSVGRGGDGSNAGGGDKVKLANADPLSVAANRPAAALGAEASSGGLGMVPLLLVAALALIAITLVAYRGATRTRGGT